MLDFRGNKRRTGRPVAQALALALTMAGALAVGTPYVAPQALSGAEAVTATSSNGELVLDYTASTYTLPTGGGSVTYTYKVTNKSAYTYYGSTVVGAPGPSITDSACGPLVVKSGSNTLYAGQTTVYTCTTTLTQSTLSTVNLHFASRPGTGFYTDLSAQNFVQVGSGSTSTSMAKIDCTVPKIWDMATVDTNDNPVLAQKQTTYGSTLHQQYQTPATSQFQPINFNPTTTWSWNALAYRSTDQLLYGITNDDRGQEAGHLIQVDANGQINDLGLIGAATGWKFQTSPQFSQNAQTNWEYDIKSGINTGVFGADGAYYVSNGSGNGLGLLYRIDIATRTVTQVTTGGTKLTTNDFTLAGGALWGIDNTTGKMYRIVTNGTQQAIVSTWDISSLGIPTGIYGAAWTYGNGNLGFDNNANGGVYQIHIDSPLGTPTFSLVSVGKGESSYNNDGASCNPGTNTDLAITKSAPASVPVGGKVTFTLAVKNLGPGISSGGYVTDQLPAGYTNVAVDPAFANSCTVTGNKVTCFTGQLNVGDGYDITLTATAPSTAGTCLTNTATILGNELDNGTANNSGSEQTCTTTAKIDIAKSMSAVAVTGPDANGAYTASYTVKVSNTGTTAGTYTQITDVPAFGSPYTLTGVTWEGGPANAAATTATGDMYNGYKIGTSAAKTLAAGATDTYTVKVTYTQNATAVSTSTSADCAVAPNDQTGSGLFNRVTLPEETADSASNTACVTPRPKLNLVKALTRATTGDVAQVGITLLGGASQATASTGATGTSADTGKAEYVAGQTYTLGDTMTTGAIANYDSSLACTNATTGSTTVLPSGTGTSFDLKLGPVDDITCTYTNTPKAVPAFAVAKTTDTTPIVLAADATTASHAWTVTVTNTGNGAGTSPVVLDTPALPAGFTISKVTIDGVVVTATNGSYQVSAGDQLAAGASKAHAVVIDYAVDQSKVTAAGRTALGTCDASDATPDATKGLYNLASMTGDADTSNNDACVTVRLAEFGSATLTKTDAASGAKLDGAVFNLYSTTASTWANGAPAPAAGVCTTATTGTPLATGLTSANGGLVQMTGLKLATFDYTTNQPQTSGTYTVYCLVETKAPVGHELSAKPVPFTVTSSTTVASVSVKDVVRNLGNALPATGGEGVQGGLGALVLLAGAGGLAAARSRRRD